ncbi:hypothetical protein IMCC9480_2907 [Oxalobacteraceae bacterium IMCC9480]|nr:hypothetical protein IMCC9480_2907 [Oxalobacteraceae bacterium IMCC9480]
MQVKFVHVKSAINDVQACNWVEAIGMTPSGAMPTTKNSVS